MSDIALHKPGVMDICVCRSCGDLALEAIREIDRLRGCIRSLMSVVQDAVEWDGCDAEGVPAVWLEAAEEVLKECAL